MPAAAKVGLYAAGAGVKQWWQLPCHRVRALYLLQQKRANLPSTAQHHTPLES
jgi:hypothetical protein